MDEISRYCMYAKVYGERNTGTTFIEELLRANFGVQCLLGTAKVSAFLRVAEQGLPADQKGSFRSAVQDIEEERLISSDFGWKHGVPPVPQIASAYHTPHTLFLCVAKHPLAWLKSLMRRPYNPSEAPPKNLSRFVRYDWPLAKRDNLHDTERINVVDLWSAKYSALVDLEPHVLHYSRIAYEDVLRDPVQFLSDLSRKLRRRNDEFVWSLPSTKADNMTFDTYRKKYLEADLLADFKTDDLEFVHKHVDPLAMTAFGYSLPSRHSGSA